MGRVTEEMTVREVMTRYPQSRPVFQKYGLIGCGGPNGPVEKIGFFATVHQVDGVQLLRDLNAAVEAAAPTPEPAPAAPEEENGDLYRGFLKAATLLVMTAGATLGAINLTTIAQRGTLELQASYPWWKPVIQAHGHVQLYGWVGLFIMGVALHVLPRMKATRLWGGRLGDAALWLMVSGILLRSGSQPALPSAVAGSLFVGGSLLEVAAVLLFALVAVLTVAGSSQPRAHFEKFLWAGTAWFGVGTLAGLGSALWMVATGSTFLPDAFDSAYLHVLVMGFIGMWILGMSARILPSFLGLQDSDEPAIHRVFWGLNLCVALRAAAELFRGNGAANVLAAAAALGEMVAVLGYLRAIRLFRRPAHTMEEDVLVRRFVRAAYFWLVFAAGMLVLISGYEALTGTIANPELRHALVGSYRHAITVGFITLITLGVAARILPVFRGVDWQGRRALAATFWLVLIGNTLRVALQAGAGLAGGLFYPLMGISGWMEVTGLALFAWGLWRTIDAPVEGAEAALPAAQPDGMPIGATSLVGEVLERYPQTLQVFLEHGFDHLKNPVVRKTLARSVPVAHACHMRHLDLPTFLAELNAAAGAN